MSEYSEKRFSIDAGAGKKMDGCPYSLFEDGHDVQEYIIPPKGHKFIGFECVMMPENRIYDGKLIAKYEKEPLSQRMMAYLKYVLLALGILAVIGIIILLFVRPFQSGDTTKPTEPQEENPISVADTTVAPIPTERQTPILDTLAAADTTQTVTETETQPAATPDLAFQQAFWELIHSRETSMDAYHNLYEQYKTQGVSGTEFEYLRLTILKDWVTYKEWYTKLKKIPVSDLQNMTSVNELIEKLNEQ
ncbi:MAG: hypothetical protein HUK16_00970 [Bacteroidales bacterium]|nr:hypothetical protein [Bacteroidales bacterium]